MNTTPTKLGTNLPFHVAAYRPVGEKMGRLVVFFSFFFSILSVALLGSFWIPSSEAASNQVKLLEIPLPEGSTPKAMRFPLYEQESVQYFSAGLGTKERSLTYPPFPLKLIFVQGQRSYLASVPVHIMKEDGAPLLMIPQEEVEGPWLFINIPSGTYVMSSESNGTTIKKTITVQTEKLTVVHFRWP